MKLSRLIELQNFPTKIMNTIYLIRVVICIFDYGKINNSIETTSKTLSTPTKIKETLNNEGNWSESSSNNYPSKDFWWHPWVKMQSHQRC